MVLVDTSVWIQHFRQGSKKLIQRLEAGEVLLHPFVLGELACGNLKNRSEILTLLNALPQAPVADFEQVIFLIEKNNLAGKGIGFIDAHLLSSARLEGAFLWTLDKKLLKAAHTLKVAL